VERLVVVGPPGLEPGSAGYEAVGRNSKGIARGQEEHEEPFRKSWFPWWARQGKSRLS